MSNVLFFNKKGGQGKTTLATNYAKKIKAKFLTNDENNFTETIFDIETYMIKKNDSIESVEIANNQSNVFDFGGFTDERVMLVAGFCDFCVIPICYQSNAELKVANETFKTLKSVNDNVCFVVNNTENEHINELKEYLKTLAPTFVIPRSSFLRDNKKDIYTIYQESNGLQKYTMEQKVLPSFNNFFNYLGV